MDFACSSHSSSVEKSDDDDSKCFGLQKGACADYPACCGDDGICHREWDGCDNTALCENNRECKKDGLDGNCCPNDDGTYLDCCNDPTITCKYNSDCPKSMPKCLKGTCTYNK